MRLTRPGTLPWLVAHEIRLTFRSARLSRRTAAIRIVLLILYILTGIGVGWALRTVPLTPAAGMPLGILVLASAVIVTMLTFMAAQALLASQRALYEAGDLDLLLSSPISESRVLAAKLLGIAGSVVATFGLLILPLALPVALLGHPRLLAVLPLLIALALVAASLGLVLTLLLVRLIGARGARTVGQILGALLGGLIFLLSQIGNLSGSNRGRVAALAERMGEGGWGSEGWSSFPARALFGEIPALIFTVAVAIAVFGGTSVLFRMLFLQGYQRAGERRSRRSGKSGKVGSVFHQSLFRVVLAKETRLLAREPELLFQVVLRLIYLLPLLFVAVRHGAAAQAFAPALLAGVGVVAAGQLCGSLAWLTISAEDTPDLLAVSPADPRLLKRMKLLAAVVMVAPVALLIPAWLAFTDPLAGLVALAGAMVACYAAGLIELKFGKPQKRSNFKRRQQGSFLASLLALITTLAIAGLTALGTYLT